MSAFSPLHNHSEFSALDGLSTCKEIAQRCAQIGCECCGISDHGTVAGHLEFAKEMRAAGIKPIFASELYHGLVPGKPPAVNRRAARDQFHLVAGAMTDEGLKNLWRLVDFGSQNHHFVGRVTWDALRKFNEGLFVTSACLQGLVTKGLQNDDYESLNQYLDIFGDRFYIELHTYPTDDQREINLGLAALAQERGIPVVYANDAHFAFPDQYEVHDAYVAAQTGETIDVPIEERKMWHPKALYMMDEGEIREALSYLPGSVVDEALANSAAIAAACSADLPEVSRHLPAFIPSESPWTPRDDDRSAPALFIDLIEEGIKERFGEDPPEEVFGRIAREMDVFLNAGLEHYFLQAWDFCKFCDENDIQRGPGRGSAAGSLCAYVLGVTDIDPLKYDLVFERFYNPGREKGFPDIDNDFPTAARKSVREYLEKRWGQERVRCIGTVTRLKPKSAVDKMSGPLGVTYAEAEALKKMIDEVPDIDILGADSVGWNEEVDPGKTVYVWEHIGADIEEWIYNQPEDRREFLVRFMDYVAVVCSRVSGYGIHPSGVVVADCDLAAELPCEARGSGKEKTPATVFAMSDVDGRMFVKQDLLGLRNIDTLMAWQEMVEEKIGVTDWRSFWSGLEGDEHPEEMWDLLAQGFTRGIFQIEDGYGRQLCKEFKPKNVHDLCIIVALNRPGPIRSGAPDSFIKRRRGEEEIAFDHPMLKDLLEPTYGWFLYQEQVIAYFSALGYDLGDADAVRKILGKKKPEDMRALRDGIGEWEGKGYFQMAEKHMYPDTAETIWAKLEDFAKYSFNKSHSLAYATIGFRTLFAKFYAPAEFTIASIATIGDDPNKEKKTADYIAEGRRRGIKVHPPDILKSGVDIEVVEGDIYFGFSNIKGIGKGCAEYIVGLRQRHDLSSPELVTQAMEIEVEAHKTGEKTGRSPRQQFNVGHEVLLRDAGAFDSYGEREDINLRERQDAEKKLLGVIVTDDVDQAFMNNMDEIEHCDSYLDLDGMIKNDKVVLPGAVSRVVPKKVRATGKSMGIVTIEYEGHEVQFAVFTQQWSNHRFLWRERTPGIFTIRKTERGFSFDSGRRLA